MLYTAYNLQIQSTLQLPELLQASSDNKPDVEIKEGAIDVVPEMLPEKGRKIWASEDEVYFNWKEVGTFLLQGQQTIVIDRNPGIADEVVRLPLLGCVLGVLLHQKGYFTLHASAVAINGRAIAFIGHKGAGKSTMAAAVHEKGHFLMADDILALEEADAGGIRSLPGFPQCKLWPESVSGLGQQSAAMQRLHPQLDKLAFRPQEGVQAEALPLHQIYVLDEGNDVKIERLSQKEAFMEVYQHQYAPRFLGQSGEDLRLFRQCQAVIKEVPVFKLSRPKEFSRLSEVATILEENVLHLGSWQVS